MSLGAIKRILVNMGFKMFSRRAFKFWDKRRVEGREFEPYSNWPHMQIHVALRQRGWSVRTRDMTWLFSIPFYFLARTASRCRKAYVLPLWFFLLSFFEFPAICNDCVVTWSRKTLKCCEEFLRFFGRTTPFAEIIKILFRKYSSRRRSTLLC